MGATWKSWRTTSTVIIALLQIQAPISVNTTAVSGVEGMKFEFKCKYVDGQQKNPKFFCRDDNGDKMSFTSLIRTQKHDQWEKSGRFSLYDNTSGAFFVVRVDALTSEDSGTYRCGVDVSLRPDHVTFIHLNVSRGTTNLPDNLTNHSTKSSVFPATVNKFHASLLVTAATCVAALLFICLFTFCLLLAVRLRRPAPQPNREASSDYETMMPGVTTEPELSCSSSVPDCDDLLVLPAAAPPPPPPDCCSHFTSKHRESTESLGLGDYVGPKPIDPYQHLDLSELEEHVYHSLNGPLGVNKHINCC
uniref:CMRF35-like molecule 9 isoform X1 n=1 Tax=Gasterosteus aculeatus aculeatus TaxID=481459 RepID=UPI001A98A40E|nr:CMRF35-like molecule 9 isoform X1 [Gasterosteus aculeatus aculeatus]